MNVILSSNNIRPVLSLLTLTLNANNPHVMYTFFFVHDYLLDPEAGVLDHVSDHGHDLGRKLPLLLGEGGAGRAGVLPPVGQEHVVRRHVRKQRQPGVHEYKVGSLEWILADNRSE